MFHPIACQIDRAAGTNTDDVHYREAYACVRAITATGSISDQDYPSRSPGSVTLHLSLFRDLECGIDVDPKVADGALQLALTEQ